MNVVHTTLQIVLLLEPHNQLAIVFITTVIRVMLEHQRAVSISRRKGDHDAINKIFNATEIRVLRDLHIIMHLQRHQKELVRAAQ